MRLLAFHPETAQIVDYHRASGDRPQPAALVPIEELTERAAAADEIVILGRGANTHHADIDHIKTLKRIRAVRKPETLSLVCFDCHHDIDNQLGGTELTSGSWVYYGLERDLFADAYILGGNPAIDHEVDPATGEAVCDDCMAIRMFDRIRLFTAVEGTACMKYRPAYAPVLANNPSVRTYRVARDRSSVMLTYRTWREADYRDLAAKAVVSIDLDVLAETEVQSDCPQGVLRVQDLVAAIERVKSHTRVIGWTMCGMDLSHGPLDQRSLRTISTVISACTQSDRTPGKDQTDEQ